MIENVVRGPEAPPRATVRRPWLEVVFDLHGMGCHVCGRPATTWRGGVTFPCGCGADRALRPTPAEGEPTP